MLLLYDGNPAAAAGDDHLVRRCQGADGLDLHDVDGLGSRDYASVALSGIFFDVIAFLDFGLGIFL